MLTRELSIQSAGATLAGELSLPDLIEDNRAKGTDRVYATVLMIHGSGPLDRNENTQRQSLNIFNALAEQLAANGIASFRYDKRGCGKSGGDYYLAGHGDLVDDASACLDHLATVAQCDAAKTFVLGHSEGTIIAAQLAARYPDLAGIILLCPFIEQMESILRRQAVQMQRDLRQATGLRNILYRSLFALLGDPVRSQHKLLTKLKTSDAPIFRVMLQKVNAKWLRELIALDNQEIYSQVTVPMLVVGGEKDIQCLPSDVAEIAAVAPAESTQHVIPDLTHILRLDPEDHTFLGYGELLKQPIDPQIGELVVGWVRDH